MQRSACGKPALSTLAMLAMLWIMALGCQGRAGDKNPSGLFVITQGGRQGYIDKKGKIVINPQFERAYGFTEGLAPVMLGGRIGYIDTDGKFAVNPQYEDAFSFYEGLAAVKAGGRLGYIDKEGKTVIEPQFDA